MKNNNRIELALIGSLVSFWLSSAGFWFIIWKLGFGPWPMTDSKQKFAAFHGTFLYFIHFIFPSYRGDLGSWNYFAEELSSHAEFDSFIFTIYGPPIAAIFMSTFVGYWLWKSLKNDSEQYERGTQIEEYKR